MDNAVSPALFGEKFPHSGAGGCGPHNFRNFVPPIRRYYQVDSPVVFITAPQGHYAMGL